MTNDLSLICHSFVTKVSLKEENLRFESVDKMLNTLIIRAISLINDPD